jgi:hypothetical protein
LEEELADAGSAEVKILLQIHDRAIAFVSVHLVVTRHVRKPIAADKFAMHTDEQHFPAIGSVEMPIRPRSIRPPRNAPVKIAFQFGGAEMFEAKYLAALGG